MKKNIVTISRQYGSGGREIGRLLAERLGVPLYDKELIVLAAKKSGFAEELFEENEDKTPNSLLYSLVMGSYSIGNRGLGSVEMPLNDRVFLIQSDIIKSVAAQGPCVIIGRCADYVLKNEHPCTNVFIHAALESRVKRAVECYGLAADKAQPAVLKTDKRRANYYNYYANQKWGKAENYHLCLDSGALSFEQNAALIASYVEMRQGG